MACTGTTLSLIMISDSQTGFAGDPGLLECYAMLIGTQSLIFNNPLCLQNMVNVF
jgi:hypothetical protein